MLEKFFKKEGTKKLSKEEQKNIAGGNDTPGLCFDYQLGKEVKC